MKNHIRSIILPIAMLLAVLLHRYCSHVYFLAPYLVFTMLFMAYTAIDFKKMHISKLIVFLLIATQFLVGPSMVPDVLNISSVTAHPRFTRFASSQLL